MLSEKWDAKLYNWWLWRWAMDADAGEGASISSIWRMDELGAPGGTRSGYRESGSAVLSGEAMDTDKLMVEIQATMPKIYEALKSWTANDGTRGAQSARLGGIHQDTYRDWVDSGKRELERLESKRRRAQTKFAVASK
ncbi:MAG: hypothetical protein ABI624_06600 [Casimicrobiaceae bacterium]